MAAIIQKPDALSLSGNLKKFILSSGTVITFQLKEGTTTLLDATYEPGGDGRVTIDVRDIVESRLSYLISHENFYSQANIVKSFTVIIDGVENTFRAIRAGVADLGDTPGNWLSVNFLTWQPVNKQVTYYSPEWITYYAPIASVMKLKAYFNDGTDQVITLGSMIAGNAYSANVQYAVVSGLLGQLYPQHYEVYVESESGTRLSYIQRYLYSEVKSEQEQWFMFENSLGGLDTIRAYGDTDFNGEHEHKIAKSGDVSLEYDVDTERLYNKNTGYLNEYERKWLLDFFPSRAKYIYTAGALRAIVVSESDVKYSASDLPSSYTFKYSFSDAVPFLNLIRNEESIPENITIPNIDSPDFILPPRLAEYPRVPLSEGVMLPAFDPHSDTPGVTTFGAILNAAVVEVLNKIQSGEGGGELVEILRSIDSREASDYSVFSSLRTLLEIYKAVEEKGSEYFLSKTKTDDAAGLIRFLAGAEFGEFISGMFSGKGAKIDDQGNIEATSLRLRAMLEVPELRYNRLTVIGDEFILTENGLIETVEHLENRSYQLNMKLEEEEHIAFLAGDLVKGIYHHANGFSTSYMRIEEVGQTFMKITLADDNDTPTGFNLPPQPIMNIARVGNVSDPDRQRYMVFSSKLGGFQFFDGASDFLNGSIISELSVSQGFKSKFENLPLKEGLTYLYAAGIVVQDIIRVDYQGVTIRTVNDRGPWQAGSTYYNNDTQGTDDVWHLGCRWRCFSSSTMEEPSWTSAAWYMIEGRSDARMEFDSSAGYAFVRGSVETDITPVVFIGNTNVSADIVEEQWNWTRESGDPVSDAIWNAQHSGQRVLPLSNEDMGTHWSKTNLVRFTCTATYPASVINQISNYIEV